MYGQNLREYYKQMGFVISAVEPLKGEIPCDGITISTDLPSEGEWKKTEIGKKQTSVSLNDEFIKIVNYHTFLDKDGRC